MTAIAEGPHTPGRTVSQRGGSPISGKNNWVPPPPIPFSRNMLTPHFPGNMRTWSPHFPMTPTRVFQLILLLYKISALELDVYYNTCNSTYRTLSWETPRRAPSTATVPVDTHIHPKRSPESKRNNYST